MTPQSLSLLFLVLVLAPLLYLRLRRMMKPQRFKPGSLWIRPAILLLAGGAVLATTPPAAADLVWLVPAALLGAGGGWWWGKLTRLHVDPADGSLVMTGSQAGMIVLVLLLVLRVGIRLGIGMEAKALPGTAAFLTDLSIVFAALLFATRGLEIFLRARSLRGDAGETALP